MQDLHAGYYNYHYHCTFVVIMNSVNNNDFSYDLMESSNYTFNKQTKETIIRLLFTLQARKANLVCMVFTCCLLLCYYLASSYTLQIVLRSSMFDYMKW